MTNDDLERRLDKIERAMVVLQQGHQTLRDSMQTGFADIRRALDRSNGRLGAVERLAWLGLGGLTVLTAVGLPVLLVLIGRWAG